MPSIFTIFGATGDLAVKKIFPALRELLQKKLLPEKFRVVAFARRALEPNILPQHLLVHHHGHFDNPTDFLSLAERVQSIEKEWGICANKLWYFAAPPVWYELLVKNLAHAGLNVPCSDGTGYSRILIEKPFGRDLASACALQKLLSAHFREEQIFRIDHYLFKEAMCRKKRFAFSEPIFANAVGARKLERIELYLWEKVGVEGRGVFYDGIGALRDVVQSHLLELLAAGAAPCGASAGADAARRCRAEILTSLAPWTERSIRAHSFRAQYDKYHNSVGIALRSKTETFVSLRTTLQHSHWKDIAVYLEAGKRMKKDRKEIALIFKHPVKKITFRLKAGTQSEHAALLSAALASDQTLFVSREEVETAWRFVDPVTRAWKLGAVPLVHYNRGSLCFFEKGCA